MSNQLEIFKNEEFGKIRMVVIDDKPYFVATDIAKALGYAKPNNAIQTHCRYTLKHSIPHPQSKNKTLEVNVIPEGDMYRLITNSELPQAEKFESWVFDEVLPQIRKTGSYQSKSKTQVDPREKEIEARYNNSLVRKANLLLKIAKDNPLVSDEYKKVLQAKATEIVTGQAILPLPQTERKTYSATEIGKMLGISSNKVGSIANKHNLKTEEYGKLFHDKSKYSNKEVESFRYYEEVIPVIKSLLN